MAYQHERVTGTPAPETRYTYERRDSSAGTWIAGGIAVALVAGLAFYFASGNETAVGTQPGAVQTVPAAPVGDATPMAPPPADVDVNVAPVAPAPVDPAPAPVAPEAAPAPAVPAPAGQ